MNKGYIFILVIVVIELSIGVLQVFSPVVRFAWACFIDLVLVGLPACGIILCIRAKRLNQPHEDE
jgi:hypothetical protein